MKTMMNNKMKWGLWSTALLLLIMLTFSSSVFAFEDLNKGPETDKIMALKNQGIINGKNATTFAPGEKLTYAQGVHLIVKSLDLNIDTLRFIKEPKASDYYKNVPDNAWYADSFIIAYHNGMTLDAEVDPTETMTREQFTHHSFQALETTGEYAFIQIFKLIKDEADINPDYMNSIQKMLILGAVETNEASKFQPTKKITRKEAALALYEVREFMKDQKQVQQPTAPELLEEIPMEVEKVNEDIQKVTLSWGEKPNSGYRMTIERITFNEETAEALIQYKLHMPSNEPHISYAQVLTYPKAVTYISSAYTPVIQAVAHHDEPVSYPGEPTAIPDAGKPNTIH
jgi:hypothetical protein